MISACSLPRGLQFEISSDFAIGLGAMNLPIDLRSDTVTLPSREMRSAMAEAELGDDVYGEDPTVNRLQELAAEMTGKEAALLVTSGTQGNLVSLMSHCQHGDEVIMEAQSHTY